MSEFAIELNNGTLTNALHGQKVNVVYKDGACLMLELANGQTARIGWYDGSKKLLGEPMLESLSFQGSLTPVGR